MNNNEMVIRGINVENSKIKIALYYGVKRFVDIICSIIGFSFLVPLTLIVKLISVLCGDFNSIFYNHERIGKNGKKFKMYKFRTMVPNADEELKKLLKGNKELAKEYKEYKKLNDDPRITKIGKFLRVTSLDELPQFINVLKGDMSLVGPRPYLPREKKDMGKYYKFIIKVKPGLTGYWQVNGRNDTSFKDRLKLDEEYIKNKSLKLDMVIFFKTIKKLIDRSGAK